MNSYVPNREDGFAYLINQLQLKVGVEIGVREGHYSEYLLANTNLDILYSIDIFPYPNMLPATQQKLNRFGSRSHIVVGPSPEVSEMFSDLFFDFIYIDANHTYQDVYNDLIAWWPKLKHDGLFCGDDYTHLTNPGEGKYGVVEAVNEFVDKFKQTLYVTGAGNNSQKELHRVALGYGKVIEAGLNGIIDIKFGTTDHDDIKIPNWYIIKQ